MSVTKGLFRVVSAEEASGLLKWLDGKEMTTEDWENQRKLLTKLRELDGAQECRKTVEKVLGKGSWALIRGTNCPGI